MLLYIAEKPSVGRALAAVLHGSPERKPGYLQCGPDVQVSWCIGHLLEPAEPDAYNPRWRQWRREDLPMVPERWQLTPRRGSETQLQVLRSLVKRATRIVHAGDPDREGQLLVDEVLHHLEVTCPVDRLLINDLNPPAIRRALQQVRDNRHFRPLCRSALARQRADWLFGLNLTRASTLQQQAQGQNGVYSVGRVQTPVLGLVVARDATLAAFTPVPYFQLDIQVLADGLKSPFRARWERPDDERWRVDDEGRLLDPEPARATLAKVLGKTGEVIESRFKTRHEAPPLPWSLSALQIEAARLFRLSAQQVLDTAQALYEKHRLITYPRSDCRYLPEGHFPQASAVIAAITHHLPGLSTLADDCDLRRRSKAWDDQRVEAHHGIIPTQRKSTGLVLSERERQLYELIARQYLMQFYPDAEHLEGLLRVQIEGETFKASESRLNSPGWQAVKHRGRATRHGAEAQSEAPPLPKLPPGHPVLAQEGEVCESLTQPPQPFTDATLLAAMTHIARHVSDPVLRKTLRDTDGLGTEATRAGIIETLFKRDYLRRDGRFIHATDKGCALIAALPAELATPDMTARWEATLDDIRQGQEDISRFQAALVEQLVQLLGRVLPTSTVSAIHCPVCRAPMRTRSGRYGAFWACTRFPQCKGTRRLDEQPEDGTALPPAPCPTCHAPLVRRHSRRGYFWGCSRYPGCTCTVADQGGHPALPRTGYEVEQ